MIKKKKLSHRDKSTLELVDRSDSDAEGWTVCSRVCFDNLVSKLPKELFEQKPDDNLILIRLTQESKIILKWI